MATPLVTRLAPRVTLVAPGVTAVGGSVAYLAGFCVVLYRLLWVEKRGDASRSIFFSVLFIIIDSLRALMLHVVLFRFVGLQGPHSTTTSLRVRDGENLDLIGRDNANNSNLLGLCNPYAIDPWIEKAREACKVLYKVWCESDI